MFTETKTVDQTTITENGVILYREASRVFRDGEMIAQTYHRTSLTPGQDLTGHPEGVATICNAAWTPEIVAAYQSAVEVSGSGASQEAPA